MAITIKTVAASAIVGDKAGKVGVFLVDGFPKQQALALVKSLKEQQVTAGILDVVPNISYEVFSGADKSTIAKFQLLKPGNLPIEVTGEIPVAPAEEPKAK